MPEDSFNFEVDADCGDEGGGEGVVGITEEEARFAHRAVANDQQLEHVVKVLVGRILLPRLALGCHLQNKTRRYASFQQQAVIIHQQFSCRRLYVLVGR